MTQQEAIERLKNIWIRDALQEDYDALDMAIKALEQKPCKYEEYEKDLNEIKEQILKDGNTLVFKQELLDRFVDVDNEYKNSPWNLLQILANINILIGEKFCENAVSRADTLQSFESYCEKNCQYSKKQRDVMCGACMMGDAIEIVENLPPVTPKQRWIPVDYDRYPETYPNAFQEVWITDGYGEVYHKAYDGTRSIKAWMPYIKPEPYKEGENE